MAVTLQGSSGNVTRIAIGSLLLLGREPSLRHSAEVVIAGHGGSLGLAPRLLHVLNITHNIPITHTAAIMTMSISTLAIIDQVPGAAILEFICESQSIFKMAGMVSEDSGNGP